MPEWRSPCSMPLPREREAAREAEREAEKEVSLGLAGAGRAMAPPYRGASLIKNDPTRQDLQGP